ncbi:MAG TPA: pentapeptide repeat-containing protein, partial [Ktedonobacterales bacterium]|nr:pentapeptide repeat-containing protein [Ktedonobacterales bacterium]
SFITYLLVIVAFAALYFVLRESVSPALSPVDALIFSITSFHGRGFAPGEAVSLHNPLTILAAGEAVLGLLIEITFIATFTQRFFAQ